MISPAIVEREKHSRAPFLDAALERAKVCVGVDVRVASLRFPQGVSSGPSGIVGEPLLDVAPDRRERVRSGARS